MSGTKQIEDGQNIKVNQSIVAPVGEPAVNITGDRVKVKVGRHGSITAPDEGNTAVLSSGDEVEIVNKGNVSGALNAISSSGNGLTLKNGRKGSISSDSRAIDLADGDHITVINSGSITGTGNQRNGTLYVDGTVDSLNLTNKHNGVIDAGAGNIGDGISIQVGAEGDTVSDNINVINRGTITGRGQAEFGSGEERLTDNGSSGVRLFNGSGAQQADAMSSFTNTGTISAEAESGFSGGVVVEDGVGYRGEINNTGSISGSQNGIYVGDAKHNSTITNEQSGIIESGSRVVNLDGEDLTFNNKGLAIGTGDQRNGTVYVSGTGDDIFVNNQGRGVIDAGHGNSGSGLSVQVGEANALEHGADDLESIVDITNNGLIQARGSENVPAGIRLFAGSGLEQSTFTGDIVNKTGGTIASQSDAGILIEHGVVFNGKIINRGKIASGNGLAINAAGALGDIHVTNTRFANIEGAVVLGEGNDTFVNHSSSGVDITGGGGNDILTGGDGMNTYRFQDGSGQDTITDFQISHDLLDLGTYFNDVHHALGAASQAGNDTFIDLGNDNSITLANVRSDDLSAENFSFS